MKLPLLEALHLADSFSAYLVLSVLICVEYLVCDFVSISILIVL